MKKTQNHQHQDSGTNVHPNYSPTLKEKLVSHKIPLFQAFEFLLRPRPSPLGKKGPSSVKAPPPIEEHPGPEKDGHLMN